MKNWKRYLALPLFIVIAGCVEPAQSIQDVHTGASAGTSKEYVAAKSFNSRIVAKAVVGVRGNEKAYGVAIRRNGNGAWAHYNSAYSFGVKLPYTPGKATMGMCAPFGCDIAERGAVELTEAQFRQAERQGMEIRLVGTGDSVVIKVPASAFQEALAQLPRQ